MAIYYFLTGVLTALWGATLPATDARLDLGPARLGVVLLTLGLGAVIAMPVAGRLVDRWTSGTLLTWSAPACAVAAAGPALAFSVGSLEVAAFVLGVLMGALNVALTSLAVQVERRRDRPIMSTLHGMWTLGAVAGGAATTAGLRAGLDPRAIIVLGAMALAVAFRLPTRGLPAATPTARSDGGATDGAAARTRAVVLLGVIGAAAFLTEGTAVDWAGVHARRVLGADPATASLVYTVFFAAMTVVRFLGDLVRARLGPALTVRLAGLTAVTGYGLILLAPAVGAGRLACAISGWSLAGSGIALVWPVVASAAGSGSARDLSTVTTISYTGGLAGPAVIGYAATATSIPAAMTIPAVLALVVAVTGPRVLRARLGSEDGCPTEPHHRVGARQA